MEIKPGLPSKKGWMELDPLDNITNKESLAISIAIAQYIVIRSGFDYWKYIVQNGAERHFRDTSEDKAGIHPVAARQLRS